MSRNIHKDKREHQWLPQPRCGRGRIRSGASRNRSRPGKAAALFNFIARISSEQVARAQTRDSDPFLRIYLSRSGATGPGTALGEDPARAIPPEKKGYRRLSSRSAFWKSSRTSTTTF